MSKNKRLKEFREYLRLTQAQMADALGIKQSAYSSMESGNSDIKIKHIETLKKNYNMNEAWLLSGIGPILDNANENLDTKYISLVGESKFPDHFQKFILPIFGDANAGYIVGYSQEEKEMYFESYTLPTHLGQNARAFVVNGESMLPILNREDIVFCKRVLDLSLHRFFKEDIYVIVSNEGIVIKHVLYDKETNFLKLIPSNNEFSAYLLHTSDIMEVWRAEGKYSRL